MRQGLRALGACVGLVLVLVACGGDSDGGSAPSSSRRPVEGFGEVAFRVDDGARRCALLAETAAQRSAGLMGRTDLAGYDGMVFRFDGDTSGSFYMLNTPMPLSIAWFDAAGRFVSATDMDPCLTGPDCPTYAPAGPYRYAIEVPRGALPELGIGPGSRLSLEGACE